MKHEKGISRIFVLLLSVMLMVMTMGIFVFAEGEDQILPDGVTYMDETGTEQSLARSEFKIIGLDIAQDPSDKVELSDGWYVAMGSASYVNRAEVTGNAKLILLDRVPLTFESGIHVPDGSTLSIYSQPGSRDTWGKLIATGDKGNAGIGGNITRSADAEEKCGTINIYGGWIQATGGEYAAGIGGGYGIIKYGQEVGGDSGQYNQTNGYVEAKGGTLSAGLGGGRRGDAGGDIVIDGGTLEATGGEAGAGIGGGEALISLASDGGSGGSSNNITINGGVVRAFGTGGGAGIGAGKGANGSKSDDKLIKINGGNVTAFGSEGGAGIGGSLNDVSDFYMYGAGANVEISGTAYVNAKGGAEAAGIGASRSNDEGSGDVKIHGSAEVHAQGGDYAAGIGTGNEPCKIAINSEWPNIYNIKIYENAKVYATGGKEGAGIGTGNEGIRSSGAAGKLEISGSAEVTAKGGKYGAGIGGGDQNVNGTVTISGGTVNATGGYGGAGIGGGDAAHDDSQAGDVNISGGVVNANGGDYGAGIGAGDTSNMKCKLNVTGGKVTAIAGKEAAGIGGGNHTYFGGGGNGGEVNINFATTLAEDDAYVLATSGAGSSPIGHGQDATECGTLSLKVRPSVKSTTVAAGYDQVNGQRPDTYSERITICQSDGVRTALIQNCAHDYAKYTYIDEDEHLMRCPACGLQENQKHTPGSDGEACDKCNYQGATWEVILEEGKPARPHPDRTMEVPKGKSYPLLEHDEQYVPQNDFNVKTHAFEGWASESVLSEIESINFDDPVNQEEIATAKAAIAKLKKDGDEITPTGDGEVYTAIYTKLVSLSFAPDSESDEREFLGGDPKTMYSTMKLPNKTGFVDADGRTFAGWIDPEDNNKEYAPGASYTLTRQEVTLLVKWEDHVHDFTDGHHEAVAATCEEAGYVEYWECNTCGRIFLDAEGTKEVTKDGELIIDPIGHLWDEPIYTWSDDYSTVTASRVCLHDAQHKQTETVNSSIKSETPASCTNEGTKIYTASFENTAFEDQTATETIPKVAHTWGDWAVKDGSDGKIEIRTCSVCGATEEREAGHEHHLVPVEQVDPKCEAQGVKAYWVCEDDESAGTKGCGKWYADKDGNQEITGDTDDERKASWSIPATGHKLGDPTVEVIKEATCEEEGVLMVRRACENCNFVKLEQPNTPALGHNWDQGTVTKAATCTEAGVKTYTCLNDPDHTKTSTIAALGHDWGEWKEVTIDGVVYDQRECSRCEEVQKVAKEDTACAHEAELVPSTATCLKDGLAEHYECSNCGAYLEQNGDTYKAVGKDELDAYLAGLKEKRLGHDWGEVTYSWADDGSSCTASRVCNRDDSHIEEEEGEITEEVTKEATETEPGEKICTATFSNDDFAPQTKTVTIPKKGSDVKPTPAPTQAKAVLVAKGIASGKKAMKISWNKVAGADRYVIYMSKCNYKGKKYNEKAVKTVNGNTFKWTKKKLKKKTCYKFYVVAQKKTASGYVTIAKSNEGHALTSNRRGKSTNPKSLKLKKTSFTLSKGGSATIKGTVKKVKKGKRLLTSHEPLFRYISNNPAVATVDRNGRITAKSSGTAVIYVQTINGMWKTVKVTVR